MDVDVDMDMEAEVAFHKLNFVAKSAHKTDDRVNALSHLPPCLAERAIFEAAEIPCHLCDAASNSAEEAIRHNRSEHSSVGVTCGFCGLSVPSPVALSLHQMVVDRSATCQRCGEPTDDEEESAAHICHPTRLKAKEGPDDDRSRLRLACPLGCAPTRLFPNLDEMEEHLSTLHGWEDDCAVAESESGSGGASVALDVHPEMMSDCPMCGAALNVMNKSMLSHVFYQCNARCGLLRETARGVQELADETGADADLLMGMELEAHVHHWLSEKPMEAAAAAQSTDLKYKMLPDKFYETYLAAVPRGFDEAELRRRRDDLPFLTKVWNAHMERQESNGASAELLRCLR